jgi:hypothetical protein
VQNTQNQKSNNPLNIHTVTVISHISLQMACGDVHIFHTPSWIYQKWWLPEFIRTGEKISISYLQDRL